MRVEYRVVWDPGDEHQSATECETIEQARALLGRPRSYPAEVQGRTVTDWRHIAVPAPEPTCDHCTPVGTFGLADPADPRVIEGQRVTHLGHVPDPVLHAADCPTLRAEGEG